MISNLEQVDPANVPYSEPDIAKSLNKLKDFVKDYVDFAEDFPMLAVLDSLWRSYHPTSWLHDLKQATSRLLVLTSNSGVDPYAILGCETNLAIMLLFQSKLLKNGYSNLLTHHKQSLAELHKKGIDLEKAYANMQIIRDEQLEQLEKTNALENKLKFLEKKSRTLIKESQSLKDENDKLIEKLLESISSNKALQNREHALTEALRLERERNRMRNSLEGDKKSNGSSESDPSSERTLGLIYTNSQYLSKIPNRLTQDSLQLGLSSRQSCCSEKHNSYGDISPRERLAFPSQSCESLAPPLHKRALKHQSPLGIYELSTSSLTLSKKTSIHSNLQANPINQEDLANYLNTNQEDSPSTYLTGVSAVDCFSELENFQEFCNQCFQQSSQSLSPIQTHTKTHSNIQQVVQSFSQDIQLLKVSKVRKYYSLNFSPNYFSWTSKKNRCKTLATPVELVLSETLKSDTENDKLSNIDHRHNAKLQLLSNQSNCTLSSLQSHCDAGAELNIQSILSSTENLETQILSQAFRQIAQGDYVWKSTRKLIGSEKRQLRFLKVDIHSRVVSWSKSPSESGLRKSGRRNNIRIAGFHSVRIVADAITYADLPQPGPKDPPIPSHRPPPLSIVLETANNRHIKFKLFTLEQHQLWERALRQIPLITRTISTSSPTIRLNSPFLSGKSLR